MFRGSVVPGFRFPQVVSDERQSARLAAAHLMDRGFRSLAYCHIPNQPNYRDQMGPTFAQAVRRSRRNMRVFGPMAWQTAAKQTDAR